MRCCHILQTCFALQFCHATKECECWMIIKQGYAFAKTLASLPIGLALALASKSPRREVVRSSAVSHNSERGTGSGCCPMACRDCGVELWGMTGNDGSIMVEPWEIMGNYGNCGDLRVNYG